MSTGQMKEVRIAGDGLAGLLLAIDLSKMDARVIVYGTGEYRPRSVYTAIYPYEPISILASQKPKHFRSLNQMRVVNGRNEKASVIMPNNRYSLVNTVGLMNDLRLDCERNGVVFVEQELQTIEPRKVPWVDCTGYNSRFKTPEFDPLTEWVIGGSYEGNMGHNLSDSMVLIIGPGGGTNWICPSFANGSVDVVYSAYGFLSQTDKFMEGASKGLMTLLDFANSNNICTVGESPTVQFSGAINGEITPQKSGIYGAGQAAGIAGPGSGDCFRRTVNESESIARMIIDGVSPDLMTRWRKKRYRTDRTLFCAVMQRIPHQNQPDKLGQVVQFCEQLNSRGERGIRMAEKYILEGHLSFGMIPLLIRQKWFIRALPKIVCNLLVASTYGTQKVGPRGYYLPN